MTNTCKKCYAVLATARNRQYADRWRQLEKLGQLHLHTRKCSICRVIKTLDFFSPSEYRCKECGARRQYGPRRTTHRYTVAKHIAKTRNLPFLLTKQQYESKIAQGCVYCCGPVSRSGMGLDRVLSDPKIGYTLNNAVPCCEHCNRTKSDVFTFEEMVEVLGPAIRGIREKRKEEGKDLPKSSIGRPRKYADS